VLDFDVPTHFLPDDVVVNPMSILSESEGIESGNFAFYWGESGALYGGVLNVDRYGTITKARESFESSLYWRNRGTYEPHPKITYESPIADEFLIGCGSSMFDNGYECSLSARYQEYLVGFNSSISEELSESQFEQIVKDIDQQMIFFLGQ
jgi:hypothetical protein